MNRGTFKSMHPRWPVPVEVYLDEIAFDYVINPVLREAGVSCKGL